MNKKIIAVIVAILIIAIAGVLIYMVAGNSNNSKENNTANQTNNRTENKNTNNEISGDANILVLYFSWSGNTQAVANIIHDEVGGDIIRLETAEPYTDDYNELLDEAQEEQRENARPELATTIDNIDNYDVIFLGYPIWWGDMPMAIYTFLDDYDLSGKTIVPFVTSGGSGLSGTPDNIQREEANATVADGLAIGDDEAANSKDEVVAWLDSLGY